MSSGGAALQPTFNGHVASTQDALILFEGCLQGHLSHVPRRPHDRERSSLIRSGSVFIYEENASGIKRWTDGVTWSPSRILGNFLVYRELDKPFPPGEKKRALKKPNRRPSRPGEPYPAAPQRSQDFQSSSPSGNAYGANERHPSVGERQLIGSLTGSYGFKQSGLVKETMSGTVQGVTHHLVSYYNVEDVMNGGLRTPSTTETLQYIRPRPELTTKQSFRSPIDEAEDVSEISGQPGYAYRMSHAGYDYGKPQPQLYYAGQPYPPTMHGQSPIPQYPGSIPSLQSGYLQTNLPPTQMGQDRSPYPQYDHNGYSRNMPPTPTSSIPTSMPDRPQPPIFSSASMGRPMNTTLSPITMDSRGSVYRGSNYIPPPITSPTEPQRPTQQSPTSHKYEDRRDHPQSIPASYPGPGAPYYGPGQMNNSWQGQPAQ